MDAEYRVIGADGQEYGPVSLASLRQWAAEGRLVASSLVRAGGGRWVEARSLPELAPHLRGAAPSPPPPPPPAPPAAAAGPAAPASWPEGVPPEFRVWDFLGRAWEMVQPHWLPLAAVFVILFLLQSLGTAGACLQFVIGGALLVGVWRIVLAVVARRTPAVGTMFEGFDRFVDALLGYLVRTILIALACLLLIVPGIILALMWCFMFPILAETRLGFWEAMRESARLTEGYRFRLFLLALACVPILILGLVVACVGVFVALPVCYTAFALAYRFLQARRAGLRPPS